MERSIPFFRNLLSASALDDSEVFPRILCDQFGLSILQRRKVDQIGTDSERECSSRKEICSRRE